MYLICIVWVNFDHNDGLDIVPRRPGLLKVSSMTSLPLLYTFRSPQIKNHHSSTIYHPPTYSYTICYTPILIHLPYQRLFAFTAQLNLTPLHFTMLPVTLFMSLSPHKLQNKLQKLSWSSFIHLPKLSQCSATLPYAFSLFTLLAHFTPRHHSPTFYRTLHTPIPTAHPFITLFRRYTLTYSLKFIRTLVHSTLTCPNFTTPPVVNHHTLYSYSLFIQT